MDWYQNDLYTRLHPGAAIVLIMTRWHSLDLAGQLLEQANEGGEQWEVVSLPAIAEEHDLIGRQPGEALWPERYSVEDFDRIKKTVGSYAFSALYQQTPTPRDGGFFKPEWFRIVEPAPIPPNSNLCRAWDTAATVGGGDYTAGVWMCRTGDTYRVKHVSRGQWSPATRRTVQRQIAETDGRETIVHLAQDPGSAGVDQVQHDTRNLIGYGVISKRPTGSKEVRAMPMAAAFESGSIELERGDWNRDFIDELCSFPTGKHDDQVDAAADAFNYLSPIQPFRYVS
jgi:predicted phage terminase large subunit-like protein